MCGIGAIWEEIYNVNTSIQNVIETSLRRRGPSSFSSLDLPLSTKQLTGTTTLCQLLAAVLHIQGSSITNQPLIDHSIGNILLWNGEVFGGLQELMEVDRVKSDTLLVLERLNEISSSFEKNIHSTEDLSRFIIEALSCIEGPYSFIFFHEDSQRIFYGRDPFGRRSLLMHKNERNMLILSSVSYFSSFEVLPQLDWEEVPIGAIYSIGLSGVLDDLLRHPWPASQLSLGRYVSEDELMLHSNGSFEDYVSEFLCKLQGSIDRRVASLSTSRSSSLESRGRCRVGVLFSGGIDSLLIAALLHKSLPEEDSIELINIAFKYGSDSGGSGSECAGLLAPDRLAGIAGLAELQSLFPDRDWRLVEVDVSTEERESHEPRIRSLIQPCSTHMDLNIGSAFWFASRGIGFRRSYDASSLSDLIYSVNNSSDRPVLRLGETGALRGVGLDPVAAATATGAGSANALSLSQSQGKCAVSKCERVGKRKCAGGFCKRCCDRNFQEQLLQQQPGEGEGEEGGGAIDGGARTKQLQFPLNPCPVHRAKPKQILKQQRRMEAAGAAGGSPSLSVEREELSQAAEEEDRVERSESASASAKEHETIRNSEQTKEREEGEEERSAADGRRASGLPVCIAEREYVAQCRVLLIGLGADEQLAGYSRHRTVFTKEGSEGLRKELNVDLQRLWQRNLGRDDRCIADNGKEAWFPYLDEQLVLFIQSTPLTKLVDLSLPQGVGDKRILRSAAMQLGLTNSAQLVKRAIQFGTLAAKQTSEQYYGSRRKGKGNSSI